MNCQTAQKLLNGYADNELDLLNHLKVEEHLKECSPCELALENIASLRSTMGDSSFYFEAPPGLQMRIQREIRGTEEGSTTANRWWQWRLVPALAAAAAIVLAVLFFVRSGPTNDDLLAKEVVSSHVRSMMANHLTDVPSSDQHTVKPWFDGKLDFSPPVVDLAAQGFPVIGGRLDYISSRPVAALVYQRKQHFINLFIFPSTSDSDSGNKMVVRQGYNLAHWNKSGMTFWAVSDLNLNELQEFVQGIQN